MVKVIKIILLLLIFKFIEIPVFCQNYYYPYDWANKINDQSVSIELLDARVMNGTFYLDMEFTNMSDVEISLIRPDTTMLESSTLIIQIFPEKNSDRNFRLHNNVRSYIPVTTSQLAYITILQKDEILGLNPGVPTKYTLSIKLGELSALNWDSYYGVKLILNYRDDIKSSFELKNPVQGIVYSNLLESISVQ